MDGFDLIRAQHLHGCVRILDVLRRKLKNPVPTGAPQAASRAPAAHALVSFIRLIYGLRAVVSTGRMSSEKRYEGYRAVQSIALQLVLIAQQFDLIPGT